MIRKLGLFLALLIASPALAQVVIPGTGGGQVIPPAGTKTPVVPGQCTGTDKVVGVTSSGSLICNTDLGGGGGGSQHSIDGVNLTSNDPINFLDTAEFDWTNPAAGNLSLALKAASVADSKLASSYSGIGSCGANTFVTGLNDNGAPTCTQPSFANLSGSATAGQVPNLESLNGTLDLASGGTNQTAWTASRCVQVNAGGTALESAAAACGAGGSGDSITVATVAATDPDFIDTGRIDVTLDTVPTPDTIAWDIVANSVNATHIDETVAYAFSSTTNTFVGASYTSGAADPADTGVVRCGNNTACVAWELATPGADKTLIVDTSDILQFNGTFNATTLNEGGVAVPQAATSSTVGQVLRVTAADTYAFGALDLADTDAVTGVLPVGNWSPLTTEGDIIFRNATITTRLPRGTNGQCLTSSGTTILWGACTSGSGAQVVRKTADETVNNSTTLQDDDQLLFAVGANENWYFWAAIRVDSSTVADLTATFTGPSGSTVRWNGVLGGQDISTTSPENSAASPFAGGGAGQIQSYYVFGFVSTGGTAGNLTFQWAQNSPEVSDTIVKANSYLLACKATTTCFSSGSGTQHSIDGVNLTSNDPVNFQDTTTIDFTNPSAGNVQAAVKSNAITATHIDETADYSFAILSGKQDRNNAAVNDNDCTGEQGLWWYDTTDLRFEFCDANTGVPAVLGGGSSNSFTTIGTATADTSIDTLTVTDSTTIDFTTTNDPEDLTAIVIGNSINATHIDETAAYAFSSATNTFVGASYSTGNATLPTTGNIRFGEGDIWRARVNVNASEIAMQVLDYATDDPTFQFFNPADPITSSAGAAPFTLIPLFGEYRFGQYADLQCGDSLGFYGLYVHENVSVSYGPTCTVDHQHAMRVMKVWNTIASDGSDDEAALQVVGGMGSSGTQAGTGRGSALLVEPDYEGGTGHTAANLRGIYIRPAAGQLASPTGTVTDWENINISYANLSLVPTVSNMYGLRIQPKAFDASFSNVYGFRIGKQSGASNVWGGLIEMAQGALGLQMENPDTPADNSILDSPILRLTGSYDSDGGAGITRTVRHADISHNVTATTPASQLDFDIGGTVRGSLLDAGVFDVTVGYRIGGAASTGNYLRGNGTNFVSSAIQAGDIAALNVTWTGQHDFTGAEILGASVLRFEGATDNNTYTTVSVADPTVARTLFIANADTATGQAITCGGTDKVSAFSAATGAFTCSADISGGTPTLDSVADPVAATDLISDATAETVLFSNTSAFSTGSQYKFNATGAFTGGTLFQVIQETGNPTAGTIVDIRAADTNVTVLRAGDGTNGITLSQAGALTAEGTGSITATLGDSATSFFSAGTLEDARLSTNVALYNNGSKTWGAGAGFNWTFDAGATDPVFEFTSGNVKFSGATTYTYEGGATDPVWTPGNSIMNLSTGTLQQGGTAVGLAGSCTNQFVRAVNNAAPTCASVGAADITDGVITPAKLTAAAREHTVTINVLSPTTSLTNLAQHKFSAAVTILRVSCSIDTGTSTTIQLDERAEATPNTAGTNVLTASLACDTNSEATTSFSNATIAADVPLNLQITAQTGTPNVLRVHIDYSID